MTARATCTAVTAAMLLLLLNVPDGRTQAETPSKGLPRFPPAAGQLPVRLREHVSEVGVPRPPEAPHDPHETPGPVRVQDLRPLV